MARWEDKDPRWLVQERQDGSNVNGRMDSLRWNCIESIDIDDLSSAGWHWEEKNQLGWSKQKLEELLVGLPVEMSAAQGHAKVTALKEVTGEALLTTRKGNKRFAVYDLNVTLTWEGLWVQDENKTVKGEVVIGEFASANEPDEYEWTVTAEGTGTAQDRLKQQIQTLQDLVYTRLQQYDEALNSLL